MGDRNQTSRDIKKPESFLRQETDPPKEEYQYQIDAVWLRKGALPRCSKDDAIISLRHAMPNNNFRREDMKMAPQNKKPNRIGWAF
jgi:hypothetical protein